MLDCKLWKHVVMPIVVTTASTILSFTLLMGVWFEHQSHLLENAGCPGWLAWLSSVLMVIAEVALINLIIMLVLFGCVQSNIIRAVLEEKGILQVLQDENRLRGRDLPEPNCCRDCGHQILFLLVRLPLLLVTLPLNAIPVLGQVAWVLLNGWLYCWELQNEFIIMSRELHRCDEQMRFVCDRRGAFFGFGSTAMALELIPIAGPWIFFASNACGAALLAEVFFKEQYEFNGRTWAPKSIVSVLA